MRRPCEVGSYCTRQRIRRITSERFDKTPARALSGRGNTLGFLWRRDGSGGFPEAPDWQSLGTCPHCGQCSERVPPCLTVLWSSIFYASKGIPWKRKPYGSMANLWRLPRQRARFRVLRLWMAWSCLRMSPCSKTSAAASCFVWTTM